MPDDMTANSPATATARLTSLDGLRGLAAVVVVFHHLSLTLPAFSDSYIVPVAQHPAVGTLAWWFTSTPAELLISGPEAVLVFFVLSGMVVALPVLKRRGFDWVAYYPQRVARLYLPVLASLVLASVWILVTVQTASRATSLWVAASSIHGLSWQRVLSAADLLFGDTTMNNPLWTLRWELLFSLMLPLFVVLAVATRRLWWLAMVLAFAVVVLGVYTKSGTLTYLPVFFFGAVLAVKIDVFRAWADRRRDRWWIHPLGAVVLVVSFLLLDLHWTIWGVLGGVPRFQVSASALETLGALGLVVVAALWAPAVRLLSTRFFRWLGRISFSLYLVHVPIIIGLDSVFGRGNDVARLIVSLVVALVIGELFSRFVELPAHRLSRRIGTSASAVVGSLFAATGEKMGASR